MSVLIVRAALSASKSPISCKGAHTQLEVLTPSPVLTAFVRSACNESGNAQCSAFLSAEDVKCTYLQCVSMVPVQTVPSQPKFDLLHKKQPSSR